MPPSSDLRLLHWKNVQSPFHIRGAENKIRSLIGTNKGRKAMRKALGMTIELDPATAIKRFWALGELLALGEPKPNKIHKDMEARTKIMKRYTAVLGKMQKKLEEEKEEREKKEKKL